MKLVNRVLNNLDLNTISLTTFSETYTTLDMLDLIDKYEEMLEPLNVKGKRIALLVPAIQEFLALVVTINKLGGTVVPLSWQFRKEDLTNILNFLDPHIIFTVNSHTGFNFAHLIMEWADSKERKTLLFTSENCLVWKPVLLHGGEKELEPDKCNYICCTSGSTGLPKGLIFSDDSFDYAFKHISDFFDIKKLDNVLVYTSTSTIFGLQSMNVVIRGGANAIVPNEFNLHAIINLMEKTNCNKVVTTPSIFKAIYSFAKHLNPKVLRKIERICLIGEKIPENFTKSFPLMNDCQFITQYGSSETGAIANAYLCENIEYTLVTGAEGREVEGELFVKTGALFTEYYKNTALTEESFNKGWFKTGDLVEFHDEKTFNIIGRKKDMIKKGGQQVAPGEVEIIISSLEGVKNVTVLGAPHDVYGEHVIAFIVGTNLTAADIRSYCKGKISAYKIPDKVIFVDELPIRQGKIDKLKLKSMVSK